MLVDIVELIARKGDEAGDGIRIAKDGGFFFFVKGIDAVKLFDDDVAFCLEIGNRMSLWRRLRRK